MFAVCGSRLNTFSSASLLILPREKVSPSLGSGTMAALGAPLQQRKPRSTALLSLSNAWRAAQRCSGPAALAAAPRSKARAPLPSLLGISLATHSRRLPPMASTSKPDAQPRGSLAQRASQVLPVAYSALLGPLQARSHSSSVHNRSARSAQLRLASSRLTPVSGGLLPSFGYGKRSIWNGPSSIDVSRGSSS